DSTSMASVDTVLQTFSIPNKAILSHLSISNLPVTLLATWHQTLAPYMTQATIRPLYITRSVLHLSPHSFLATRLRLPTTFTSFDLTSSRCLVKFIRSATVMPKYLICLVYGMLIPLETTT